MSLLDKIAVRSKELARPRPQVKSFMQLPFWESDALRLPFLGTGGLGTKYESIDEDFEAYVLSAYRANGIVFAAVAARQRVFAQARFAWRSWRNGSPGDLFGDPGLDLLERPWPGGTTAQLLARMEVTASAAGNYFGTVADNEGRLGKSAKGPSRRVVHLRPDRVVMVIGSHSDSPTAADARIIGFLHRDIGQTGETLLLPDEVAHYAPFPDPLARGRGVSWLSPVLTEIQADKAATVHKGQFFQNGATPSMVIKFDKDTAPEAFADFVEKFNAGHQGKWNAYKTLFLAGGADVKPVGANFEQLDFAETQGKGETRIAVASGVPAVILGISEGLHGSSLNEGNFAAARRLFVDTVVQDMWGHACAALANLVPRPVTAPQAELAVNTRHIPFLREDARNEADIQRIKAGAIRSLLDAGWEPNAAVQYVITNDLRVLLDQHSGLFSVQLQKPGTVFEPKAVSARPSDTPTPEPDEGADPDEDPEDQP